MPEVDLRAWRTEDQRVIAAAMGIAIFAVIVGLGWLISPAVGVIAFGVLVVLAVAGSVLGGDSWKAR